MSSPKSSNPDQRTNPSVSASERPVRIKTRSTRLKFGVDKKIRGVPDEVSPAKSPPPKAKGISIDDSSEGRSKKRHDPELSPQGKGKSKMPDPPTIPKPPKAKRSKSTSVPDKGQGSSVPNQASTVPKYIENALTEIYHHNSAPEGFSTAPTHMGLEDAERFKKFFLNKSFCPSVSVNLDKIKEDHNIDLSPWLKDYESFVSMTASYSTNLVKIFYYNMVSSNILDSEDNLVEERITTSVKGVQFTISAAIINKILQIVNPPEVPEIRLSNRDIFTTLCPHKPVPNNLLILSFKPADMSTINRIIWYIYSRNFIQKGGNYTHFTKKDYSLFAAFVRQTKFNLGHWIFQEMVKFKFSSRKPSHIPYPSLVSVILFYHKVWYVGPPDTMRTPTVFGKNQLHYMKITDDGEDSGQSHAPTGSHTRATHSRAQEAQSVPAQSSLPSDFGARIKEIVDGAVAAMQIRLEFEMGKLLAEIKRGNDEIIAFQDHLKSQVDSQSRQFTGLQQQLKRVHSELTDQIHDLDAKTSSQWVTNCSSNDKLDRILQHLGIGLSSTDIPSSSSPKPDPVTPSSPSFTFPTTQPDPSTPTTIILPSPSTPATEILPDTSPSSTTPATEPFPPHFEDDKGGEKDEV